MIGSCGEDFPTSKPCADPSGTRFSAVGGRLTSVALQTTLPPHLMTGDRAGTGSLHVTRNWRMTFRIDVVEEQICDVNLEDYH